MSSPFYRLDTAELRTLLNRGLFSNEILCAAIEFLGPTRVSIARAGFVAHSPAHFSSGARRAFNPSALIAVLKTFLSALVKIQRDGIAA